MVFMFDVFGTILNLADVPREEIKAYADQLRRPEWAPLVFPESWENLKAFPECKEMFWRFREIGTVVTMSNGPLGYLARVSKRNGLNWDMITPLELKQVYKPNPEAYKMVPELLRVPASDCWMITANPTFGDVEAAKALGMNPIVIRTADSPHKNLKDLYGWFRRNLPTRTSYETGTMPPHHLDAYG